MTKIIFDGIQFDHIIVNGHTYSFIIVNIVFVFYDNKLAYKISIVILKLYQNMKLYDLVLQKK